MFCDNYMKQVYSLLIIIVSCLLCAQSDVPRPRGVSLSKAPLYAPNKDFTCFDGTVTIPFSYVNDDYCDCFDGSDEPGTSACLNGVFHCTNAGHRAQNIPSSRVNDGVCDCCDGTDEYASSKSCDNTCEDLGREARAEALRLTELHKAGSHLRIELIEKGNKKRSEMAEQLSQLEKDWAEAKKLKDEKEAYKNEIESRENDALKVYREAEEEEKQKKAELEKENLVKEATAQFDRFDSDEDGKLSVNEISVANVFDKNKDGKVDEDEIKYFFGDNESVDKDTFISLTWPLLKPLLMMEQGMFQPENEEEAQEDERDPDIDPEEQSSDDNAEDIDDDHIDEDLPRDDDDGQEQEQVDAGKYDEETQKLIDLATEARREFSDAERAVREIEANMRNFQLNLAKDYGLQQEFATLDSQCFEYEDKEYVYKLCMFDKVTQKSKNGGSEIGLGNWGEWAGEPNKYSVMKYTNGVACWNGPSRTTTVNLMCGLETKLLSVTEPYRCEYKMELSIPAVCDSNTSHQSLHDEL